MKAFNFRKLISLSFLLITCLNVCGQKLGIAVNIDHYPDKINDDLYYHLVDGLLDSNSEDYVIYDWKNKELQLNEKSQEKPVEYAVFLKQKVNAPKDLIPQLKFDVDTSKSVRGVYLEFVLNVSYEMTLVNVKKGVYEDEMTMAVNNESIFHEKIAIKLRKSDFSKYNLPKLRRNSIKYEALAEKTRQEFKEKIVEKNKESIKIVKERILKLIPKIKQFATMKAFEIEVDKAQEQVKELKLLGGLDFGLEKGDFLEMYGIVKYGKLSMPRRLAKIKGKRIEVESSYFGKAGLQSKKKFSRIVKANDKLFGITRTAVIHKLIPQKNEDLIFLKIDFKNKKLKALKSKIINAPQLEIVTRGYISELKYLRSVYKDLKYADYPIGDLQDRELGAQYLVTEKKGNIYITDLRTNRIVSSFQEDTKRSTVLFGDLNKTLAQSFNFALLEMTQKSIEFLSVLKEKKGKIKVIQIYQPYGFEIGDEVDVSIISEETVNGEVIKRKKFLSKNIVVGIQKGVPSIAEIRIKKGGEELANALKDNVKISLSYAINR